MPQGFGTGDPILTKKLVEVAKGSVKHTITAGGQVYWEWPKTSSLWKAHAIGEFPTSKGCKEVDVSTAAVGMRFIVDSQESRPSTRNGAYAPLATLSLRTFCLKRLSLQMSNTSILLAEGQNTPVGTQRSWQRLCGTPFPHGRKRT